MSEGRVRRVEGYQRLKGRKVGRNGKKMKGWKVGKLEVSKRGM
jgi:hypothetical protein